MYTGQSAVYTGSVRCVHWFSPLCTLVSPLCTLVSPLCTLVEEGSPSLPVLGGFLSIRILFRNFLDKMKITPTGVGDALKSLQSNRFFPISDMYTRSTGQSTVQGTGSARRPPPTSSQQRQVNTPAPLSLSSASAPPTGAAADVFTFAEIAAKSPRGRTSSFKRKDPEVSPSSVNDSNDSNKKARTELSHVKNPLLAAMQENSAMLEQVANELLDATGSDPVLVSIASRLCTGMSSQNKFF